MQAVFNFIQCSRTRAAGIVLILIHLLIVIGCVGPFARRADHQSFQKYAPLARIQGGPQESSAGSIEEQLRSLDAERADEYRLGPGDEITIRAPGDERLSGNYILDPGGEIVMDPALSLRLAGSTRSEAEASITQALTAYYRYPRITLTVAHYANNHAYVLGRVLNPGKIPLAGRTHLLDALSQAGMRRSADQKLRPGRCAIIRGNRRIVWLDLAELLDRGNLALNLKLTPGDVVYVPDAGDRFVYVLGEVKRPGGYFMSARHSLLRAVGDAGGFTEHADTSAIRVVRESGAASADGAVTATVDLGEIAEDGIYARNYELAPEDVVYVPRRGVAKFNYYLRMLNPFAQVFVIGNALKNSGD